MSKLLYIKASPRGERSYSVRVADAFVDACRKNNPDTEVEVLNLFEADLPAFDGATLQAKYAILHGENPTAKEKKAWEVVERIINCFKTADVYVLAVPMWNFGISYRLKQYIDIITQPTYTFSYSPEKGYKGLVTGKPLFAAYARGGEYPADSEMDFQKKYVDVAMGFIGFTDIRSVIVQPTLAGGKETARQRLDEAIEQALTYAREIGRELYPVG